MSSNKKQIHAVAGSSGAMGSAVVKELQKRGEIVKTFARKSYGNPDTIILDPFDQEQLKKELQNVDNYFLCIGLPYSGKFWLENWPKLIQATIEACIHTKTKLIFLDNIYMYGPSPLPIPFDETYSQEVTSLKSKARKIVADLILDAIAKRGLKAILARSASFYGPNVINSSLYTSFIDRMLACKNPQTIFNPNIPITYAFTDDNAKAMVDLAFHEEAIGQVFHLPVGEPITLEEIVKVCNKILNANFKLSVMPKFLFKILSMIIPLFKEIKEVVYQYEDPYTMSFDKFKKLFPNFKVTSYEEGLEKMIESFQKN
jgi:nucleoside-diphosphate-sugar epimerase